MGTSFRQDRDFIESVVSEKLLENSIEWIRSNLVPELVFDQGDLEQWADENGYVKGDD